VTNFLLIIRYKSLGFARWLTANAFTLFILGPIILIGFYFILEPYLTVLAERLHRAADVWRMQDLYPASLALTILLIAFSLSATLKDVYATHSADAYLDALPIPTMTRFNLALFFRLLKNLPAWVMLLVILRGFGGSNIVDLAWLGVHAPLLLVVFFNVSLLQILAVLVLVHYRLFGVGRLALQAAVLFVLAVLTKWSAFFLLPLAPFLTPATVFDLAIGDALSSVNQASSRLLSPWIHLGLTIGLFAATYLAFKRWRTADRERAREIVIRRRAGREVFAVWLRRLFGGAVAAQIARDWQLTRRGFSSAVYLAGGFAVLFQGIVVFAARRYTLSAEEFSTLAQACCALSVFSLTTLPPLLAKYQLPYFWIEKCVGITSDAVWKAKFWYARLLGIPAFILSVVATVGASPLELKDEAMLVLKLLIIAFIVASLMGVMTYEVASRPVLGLIVSGLASLALPGLLIFYWVGLPLWLFVYFQIMHGLQTRARVRVWFTEVET
jgi:hypothetical protein